MEARDERTHAIIGAAMEVHRVLGCGFLEGVYRQALAAEFDIRQIAYEWEVKFPITYKGRILQTIYRADFVCFGSVIVETKALPALTTVEESQIINYLKAAALSVGLLLNFGRGSLEFRRFAN